MDKVKESNTFKKNSVQSLDSMMIQNEDQHLIPWNKLDKSIKINKLNTFADELKTQHDLSDDQVVQLKLLLKDKINHKHLQKTKDVVYDIPSGLIKSIPCLSYNAPVFIFKSVERASPLNSLTPKNKTIRHNK
jgi:replication-associated recombination protein RarA